MEESTWDELEHFSNHLRLLMKENNGLVKLGKFFNPMFSNLLAKLVTGKRFDYKDPGFQSFLKATIVFIENTNISSGIDSAFPVLSKMLPSMKTAQVAIKESIRDVNFFIQVSF